MVLMDIKEEGGYTFEKKQQKLRGPFIAGVERRSKKATALLF